MSNSSVNITSKSAEQGSQATLLSSASRVVPGHSAQINQRQIKHSGGLICKAGYHKKNSSLGSASMKYIPGFNKGIVFRVEDDSMYPSLMEGDHIVTQRLNDKAHLKPDTIVVARLQKKFMLKRIQLVNEQISLISDTKAPRNSASIVEIAEELWEVKYRFTVPILELMLPFENRLLLLEDKLEVVKRKFDDLFYDDPSQN